MRLTRRSQELLVFASIALLAAALVFVGWLGQEWKRDRINECGGATCTTD